jgi:hypothetical protein
MPVQIDYREDGAGVVMTGVGTVTMQELWAANVEVYSFANVHRQRYQLVDCTRVEGFDITLLDIRRLAAQDRAAAAANPNLIIAVVGVTDVIYGLGRMWEALVGGEGPRTRVFRTIDDAEAWIEAERSR